MDESWVSSSMSWIICRLQRLSSRTTFSDRGWSMMSEERDICEFSSSGCIREVVDSGDIRPGSEEELTMAEPGPRPAGKLRRL